MPLAVGDVIFCTYRGLYVSQRYIYTHTWKVALTTSTQSVPRDLQDIAHEFTLAGPLKFSTLYRTCLATNYLITDATAQRIWPIRSVKTSESMGVDGLASDVATTGNVAAVFTIRTQNAGRSEISNKHIGPLSNAEYNAGAVLPTLNTNLVIFALRHIASLVVTLTDTNSITLVPVIYHKSSGQTSLTDSIVVSDRIGTMRRRTLRVGE